MGRAVHIGCSGWNYDSWRGAFYPAGVATARWLRSYAERLGTVEVNATFYRLPTRTTVARWVDQTPAHFVFAVKASRYLTHIRRLHELGEGIARLYDRIDPLVQAEKLGPVLWQLPETFHRDDDRLAEALEQLPPGRRAWEFRHPSWFTDGVYELLSRHDAALVIGDSPERLFQTDELTTSWTYDRFHHGRRGRRGNYSATEIAEWADRIASWRRHLEVYAYFNNDWEAFAPGNATALAARLDRA